MPDTKKAFNARFSHDSSTRSPFAVNSQSLVIILVLWTVDEFFCMYIQATTNAKYKGLLTSVSRGKKDTPTLFPAPRFSRTPRFEKYACQVVMSISSLLRPQRAPHMHLPAQTPSPLPTSSRHSTSSNLLTSLLTPSFPSAPLTITVCTSTPSPVTPYSAGSKLRV